MKKIKIKNLIITCIVTLIPMLIGVVFYNQLPDQIPVHFNINNQPDNFASKEFSLFGIPAILAGVQLVLCIILDLTKKDDAEDVGIRKSVKWWIPILSIIIGMLLVEYPLRIRLELRMYICIALCVISMIIGNNFTEMESESIKEHSIFKIKNEKYEKIFINILGYTFIIFGLVIVLSTRFYPIISVVVTVIFAVMAVLETMFFRVKK